jgi:hypothetical protein
MVGGAVSGTVYGARTSGFWPELYPDPLVRVDVRGVEVVVEDQALRRIHRNA